MNTSKTLFTALTVLIILLILAIGAGLIMTLISIIGVPIDNVNFKNDLNFEDLNGVHYLFMALNLLFYFIFIYGLFKLRNVAKLFLNNTFYDAELGKNSNLAGKSFVLVGVFWWLFDGLSSMYIESEVSIGVSDKTFIYLFFVVIGLFLMLTSTLFDNALEMKSENDLTI